jgi:hypothetical protein
MLGTDKKHIFSAVFISAFFLSPLYSFSQANDLPDPCRQTINKFSIELKASVLPKANIETQEGNYHLQSKLQSSFSAGINYQLGLSRLWSFRSGLQFTLTKWNFFLHIPDADLPGYPSTGGAPQIEDKDLYLKVVIPFLLNRNFQCSERGFWNVSGGINLNYSGFNVDEGIAVYIGDSNHQQTTIFDGEFSGNHGNKPWLTFQLETARSFLLENYNLLAIAFSIEFSNTNFISGNYQITVPNKPITIGTYGVTGSALGLSLRYVFTGANKRIVKAHLKKKAL